MGQQGAVVDGVQRSVPLTSPSPRPRWLPGKGASPAPPSAATSSDDACRRSGMKSTLRWVNSRTLEALQRVTPKSPHAVVYGAPPDEGNAVEVVRGLSRRYRGDIYWFVDGDLRARMGEIPPNVYVIVKHSPAAMARYLSAEIVFFTHGLYGDAMPSPRQTFVNLWHGDGIKVEVDRATTHRPMHPSHFLVGGTTVLTRRKANTFRVPEGGLLMTGNPRVDQFSRGVPDGFWDEVGIDPSHPFVVWLPTFRKTRGYGATAGWSDVRGDGRDVNRCMAVAADRLRAAGLQVLVKPHPRDAEHRFIPGTRLVSNSGLARLSTTLYAVLGQSAGLITDYSSVWTDYLLLDRPIGFVVPDAEAYVKGRGVFPADVLDWLPGRDLSSAAEVEAFASEVQGRSESTASLRHRTAERLGLVRCATATDDLLDELERRGAFLVSRTLLPRSGPAPISSPTVYSGGLHGDIDHARRHAG